MSSYTQLYYHIIFAPKFREPVLLNPHRQRLYAYLWQVLVNKKCQPYAINGVEDHLHIFTHIHQSLAIASLIKDLKLSSSDMIKRERLFPKFGGWQAGYAAFTVEHAGKEEVFKYVRNQEVHHRDEVYIEELKRLLRQAGVSFEERYLE